MLLGFNGLRCGQAEALLKLDKLKISLRSLKVFRRLKGFKGV